VLGKGLREGIRTDDHKHHSQCALSWASGSGSAIACLARRLDLGFSSWCRGSPCARALESSLQRHLLQQGKVRGTSSHSRSHSCRVGEDERGIENACHDDCVPNLQGGGGAHRSRSASFFAPFPYLLRRAGGCLQRCGNSCCLVHEPMHRRQQTARSLGSIVAAVPVWCSPNSQRFSAGSGPRCSARPQSPCSRGPRGPWASARARWARSVGATRSAVAWATEQWSPAGHWCQTHLLHRLYPLLPLPALPPP